MKTAYELAMERLGGIQECSAEVKAKLSEIDSIYDAQKAKAEVDAQTALAQARGDASKQEQIRTELAAELKRIEDRRETKKAAAREGKEA